jgi:serine/threonine-protein kinase
MARTEPCPPESRLRTTLEEGAAEDPALQAHIEGCAPCRELLERLAWGSEWSPGPAALSSIEAVPPGVRKVIEESRAATGEADPAALAAAASTVLERLSPPNRAEALGRLGRYEVFSVIGRGGMGVVLGAWDEALGCNVAVKVLSPLLAAHERAKQRFAREARAAAAIRHANVVTVYNVGEENGLLYMVMDLVRGDSVEDRLRRTGSFTAAAVQRLGLEVARGLAAAHERGVLHRDIKPGNILLESDSDQARIVDFGVARCADDPSITGAGECIGTPQYMAPEQCLGREVDLRADLFSLGCVLYAASAGVSPFAAEGSVAVIRKVCDAEPRPLGEIRPDLPQWIVEAIHRLLGKDPGERFATAQEVAAVFEAGVLQPSTPAEDLARSRRRRKGLAAAVAAAALVSVALLLAPWAGDRSAEDSRSSEAVEAARELAALAFTVLGAAGAVVERHATLAEAVARASPGSTIEIAADGPFVVEPIVVRGKPLAIRAASGVRARITLVAGEGSLIDTDADLVLEGLDLGQEPPPPDTVETERVGQPPGIVRVADASLRAANLRVICQYAARPLVSLVDPRLAVLRNCELYGRSAAIHVSARTRPEASPEEPRYSILVENCVFWGGVAVSLDRGDHGGGLLQLRRNTWRGKWVLQADSFSRSATPFRVEAEGNIFGVDCVVKLMRPLRKEAARLRETLRWLDSDNLYDCDTFVGAGGPGKAVISAQVSRLDDWKRLWQSQGGAVAGTVRLRGAGPGATLAKLEPASFAVEEIKLRSAPGGAAEAHPGAAELATGGADVTIVGPGAGYARWRSSPQYAEWSAAAAAALQRPAQE